METKAITEQNNQSDRIHTAARIGHNNPPGAGIQTVALDRVTVWAPAEEQAEDVTADVIDDEVTIFADAGQRSALPARRDADGRIEVVAAAHVLKTIERYNELHLDRPLDVEVRVYAQLDDAAAFRLLAQQIEPAHAASSFARGRFFTRAVEKFGSEAEVAIGCRVSKAAVSKNLDVARAYEVIGHKVLIARDISQRNAMWLMSVLGRKPDGTDAADAGNRATLLKALNALEVAPAKNIFTALRAAVRVEAPRRGEKVLTLGDREIARLREKKGRPIRIDLCDIGDIELDTVIGVIREALALSRRAVS